MGNVLFCVHIYFIPRAEPAGYIANMYFVEKKKKQTGCA